MRPPACKRARLVILVFAAVLTLGSACRDRAAHFKGSSHDASEQRLALGARHACLLSQDGVAYCFGDNTYGQLGDGTYTARAAPTRVMTEARFVNIVAGSAHTCARTAEGKLWCWGRGDAGQLDDGTRTTRARPEPVSGSARYDRVAAFGEHTCGLRDGIPVCFGANIGRGFEPAAAGMDAAAMHWRSITTGASHACAIRGDGSLFCWGTGWLGAGAFETDAAPMRIGTHTDWLEVSAGYAHTCGLRQGLGVFCWGDDSDTPGILDALRAADAAPGAGIAVPRALPGTQGFYGLSVAGSAHGCALAEDGAALCWGDNHWGQLGTVELPAEFLPRKVAAPEPEPLADTHTEPPIWVEIATGGSHTCARTREHVVYCWGRNLDGETGIGVASTLMRSRPVLIPHPASAPWTGVGASHLGTCATATDGLYCWGLGPVGDGSQAARPIPIRVDQRPDWRAPNGGWHRCGLRAGEAACWGRNGHGALGDGSRDARTRPARIDGRLDWTALDGGSEFSCGIRAGLLFCWGYNALGQLGVGAPGPDLTTPTAVIMPTGTPSTGMDMPWARVSTGADHACALRAGALYCWGKNNTGQLGDGSAKFAVAAGEPNVPGIDHAAPNRVGNAQDWVDIDGGSWHTCGLRAPGTLYCFGKLGSVFSASVPTRIGDRDDFVLVRSGLNFSCALDRNSELWCWGENRGGQLGLGDTEPRPLPAPITPGVHASDEGAWSSDGWVDLAVGLGHACGLRRDGKLWCWGDNGSGQLGDGAWIERPTRVRHSP